MSPSHQSQRWAVIGIISAVIIGIIIIMATYLIFAQGIRRDLLNPPIVLLNEDGEIRESLVIPTLASSSLCAGGEVRWNTHLVALRDADSNIWRTLKIGKPGEGVVLRHPVTDEQQIIVNYSSFERGNVTKRPLSFDIPDWLATGDYYIVNSIQNGSGRPVRYYVPFTVSEKCQTPS